MLDESTTTETAVQPEPQLMKNLADIAASEQINKPKSARKANGATKAKPKSNVLHLVLTPTAEEGIFTAREFNEDDMLSEAAEAWGKPEIRIVQAEVLNFEITRK